ncbi:leishmanolysin family protein (macronuclear) [Tetrahymena thermophila SB210]|uniref:Leishmanolysin family protein n=1 Tax=Tetrahymena thermophila (strain SB210) TaxID=312017 RepID=Q24FH5_TETTS|nr:leishmanolysin family protein [Tetrahymena thermophila SB210]EAS06483.2 leishmanolysin family protein [Tetrahymena thermophila SB210]|eukprot:XP_001026728.2 leishmanolysin family protein [Tetrahymena thermophila SB210]
MNPNKLLLVFLLLQNIINEVQSQQNNSSMDKTQSKQHRNLAQQLQPIRVSVDYSQFDQYFVSQSDRDYVRKIFGFFQSFASSLISVVPRQSSIANNGIIWCGSTFIGAHNAIFGYQNTDFQIVISATQSIFISSRVSYHVCNWDSNYRPILMEVRYLMRKFRQSTVANDINQLKRAFMYEGLWNKDRFTYWRNPFTPPDGDLTNRQPYNVNTDLYVSQPANGGGLNYFLKGPNVQQLVRKHFNCPTAIGLQVLNQQDLANFLPNDLFSTYADQSGDNLDNFIFSQFDVAILRDMGNYEQINDGIADTILWGQNMGCDFLNNRCDDLIKTSIKQDGNLYQCNQFSTGKFQQSQQVIQNQINSGQCPYIQDSNTISCLNVNNNSQANLFGETYGSFTSAPPTINPPIRCLYTQCDISKTYITIQLPSGEYFVCKEPYQILTINTDSYQGTINCPSNFLQFCYGAACPNNCNQKGYCQNGKCNCKNGFQGDDCSIQCPLNNCTCQSPCVNCRGSSTWCTSCLAGYKLIAEKGTCQKQCDNSCLECNLPVNPTSCTSCKDGFYLYQGQCFQCQSPCQTCSQSRNNCLTCINNYTLNHLQNVCNPICYGACKECILPQQKNSCKSCFDQNYLSQQGECLPCSSQCLNCLGDSNICTKCYPGYILNPLTFQCNPICAQNCLTCTEPLSPLSCTSCEQGYYLNNNSCLSCLSITDFTKTVPNECNGLFLFNSDCNSRCKVCLATDIKFCLNCSDQTTKTPYCDCPSNSIFLNGLCRSCPSQQFFDLASSSCLKCHPSCQSCFGIKSNQCYTCFVQNGMEFNSNSNSCSCSDKDSVLMINTLSNQQQTAVCKQGMGVNFTRFYPNYQSQYQMFQATFTMNLQQNIQNSNIQQSFKFYIPEIQSSSYEIKIEAIQKNQILFQIFQKKSFHANQLVITVSSTTQISSTENILLKPSLLNKSFTLQIGPVFIDSSSGSGQNSGGISDKLDQIVGFVNYNQQVTNSINFLNQFSIFLHLVNTIQPSALFITINTSLPPLFYTLQRVMGTFVYQNVPEQSVYRADPKDCKLSYLTIDYCDLENQNPQPYNQFQRLGFSTGFFLNIQNFLNQTIIGGCIFLLTKYLLQFYNEDLSTLKDLTKSQYQNLTVEEMKHNPNLIQQQKQIQQLRRFSGVPFGYSNKKLHLVIQFLHVKSFDYFFSTFEANLLIFSVSAHLFIRVNIFDPEVQQNALVRISTYVFIISFIFLVNLLNQGYICINKSDNLDVITENLSNELKMNAGYFCKNFHLLNFLKKWLVCCLHVELYYYPKVLIIAVIVIYSFGVLLEVFFRPFQKTYQNLVRIVGDLTFAFVYFCTLRTHQIYLSLQLQAELNQNDVNQFSLWGLIATFSLIGYNGLYLILYIINLSVILYSKLCKNFFTKYREISLELGQTTKSSYKQKQLHKKLTSSLAHKETIENNNAAIFDLNCSIYSNSQFNDQYIFQKSDRSNKNNNKINLKKQQNNNQHSQKPQKTNKIKIKIDKYGNICNKNLEKFGVPIYPQRDHLSNDQL